MRTEWTAKGNRDAGSSCSCDRGLHRYLPPPSVRHCLHTFCHSCYLAHLVRTLTSTVCELLLAGTIGRQSYHSEDQTVITWRVAHQHPTPSHSISLAFSHIPFSRMTWNEVQEPPSNAPSSLSILQLDLFLGYVWKVGVAPYHIKWNRNTTNLAVFLWISDQLVAQTSVWQHTTATTTYNDTRQ